MLSKLLLFIFTLVLVIVTPPLLGAYHYGIIGFFAGVGIAFVLFNAVMFITRFLFKKRMKKIELRMMEEANLLEDAEIRQLCLETADRGALLEGDDEEMRNLYPISYKLDIELSPSHQKRWKPECLNLIADFDNSLLNDVQDPDESGYGLYTYSIKLLQEDGTLTPLTETSGRVIVRAHFGVGSAIKQFKLQAHDKFLKDFTL